MGMDALSCALWLLAAIQPHEPLSMAATKATQQIDPAHSTARFTVHPHLQRAMTGTFDAPTGTLEKLAKGRLRIDFSLKAASVAFADSQRITGLTRSEAFFDAAHHPVVHFRSDPFAASILRDGGTLSGELNLRGTSRPVRFVFAKATCGQPGLACPIHAVGRISRSAFGMTRYKLIVGDAVDIAVDMRLWDAP
jgi:polyisoprenoid-binding protein YceI